MTRYPATIDPSRSPLIPILATTAAMLGAVVGVGYLTEAAINSERREKLDLVGRIADADRDGKTAENEWAAVYREVGRRFDPPFRSAPSDGDLDRYLANHATEAEAFRQEQR